MKKMKKGIKVCATNRTSGEQVILGSVKEAARHAGISPSAMTHRIRASYVGENEWEYTYVEEKLEDLSYQQLRYRGLKKSYRWADDDIELDGRKYRLMKYDVKHGRICITPCPFKEYPKPFIGSMNCISCSNFRGRNKKTHQVACKHQ